MRRTCVPFLTPLSLLFVCSIASAASTAGRVTAETGEGLPARVLAIQPQTRASAEVYTKPDGSFTLEVPEGILRLVVSHGPEWSIVEIEAACMTVLTDGSAVEMTVPVKAGDWVTAELYGVWPEFATTNAWYVR